MTKWRAQNRHKLKEYTRRHYEKHKATLRKKHQAYYRRFKERARQLGKSWLKNNREHFRAWLIEYRKCPEVIARQRARFLERKAKEPNFALALTLRCRLRRAVKTQAGKKAAKSIKLLGASIDTARKHIESQFEPGMTWENFGRGGWHLDHIVPCSAFDLRDPKQQRKCFHFTNLRPLWESVNLRKGSTVPGELQLQYRLPGTRRVRS